MGLFSSHSTVGSNESNSGPPRLDLLLPPEEKLIASRLPDLGGTSNKHHKQPFTGRRRFLRHINAIKSKPAKGIVTAECRIDDTIEHETAEEQKTAKVQPSATSLGACSDDELDSSASSLTATEDYACSPSQPAYRATVLAFPVKKDFVMAVPINNDFSTCIPSAAVETPSQDHGTTTKTQKARGDSKGDVSNSSQVHLNRSLPTATTSHGYSDTPTLCRLQTYLKSSVPYFLRLIQMKRSDQNNLKRIQKTVRFDKVMIRRYDRVVGDNPSCTCGVPISLGWECLSVQECTLDLYEETVKQEREGRRTSKNNVKIFHLSPAQRRDLLMQVWACCPKEINNACKEISAIRQTAKAKPQRTLLQIQIERMQLEEAQKHENKLLQTIYKQEEDYHKFLEMESSNTDNGMIQLVRINPSRRRQHRHEAADIQAAELASQAHPHTKPRLS